MLVSKNRNVSPPLSDLAQKRSDGNRISAHEMLKQRYARGEIDREEYAQIKNGLA